jgi:hypothetical protein
MGAVLGPASRADFPVPVTSHSSMSGRCGLSWTRIPTAASAMVTLRTVASLASSIRSAVIPADPMLPPVHRSIDRSVTRTPCSGVPLIWQRSMSTVAVPPICTAVRADAMIVQSASRTAASLVMNAPLPPASATEQRIADNFAVS